MNSLKGVLGQWVAHGAKGGVLEHQEGVQEGCQKGWFRGPKGLFWAIRRGAFFWVIRRVLFWDMRGVCFLGYQRGVVLGYQRGVFSGFVRGVLLWDMG